MKHELLDLYHAACESKDEDVIKAFQRARDRIGPQIAVDLILENNRLRAELTTCKSFHDVAVKERDAERREVDKLRTELAAERKKREEAEEQVGLDTKMMDYRDKQIVNLEAQVEVLRRSLENISNLKIDPTSPEIFYHHVTDLTSLALANLPARSAAIRKVLETADAFVEKHNQLKHSDVLALCKAVREWREVK